MTTTAGFAGGSTREQGQADGHGKMAPGEASAVLGPRSRQNPHNSNNRRRRRSGQWHRALTLYHSQCPSSPWDHYCCPPHCTDEKLRHCCLRSHGSEWQGWPPVLALRGSGLVSAVEGFGAGVPLLAVWLSFWAICICDLIIPSQPPPGIGKVITAPGPGMKSWRG